MLVMNLLSCPDRHMTLTGDLVLVAWFLLTRAFYYDILCNVMGGCGWFGWWEGGWVRVVLVGWGVRAGADPT